jgi:hypothetical protein
LEGFQESQQSPARTVLEVGCWSVVPSSFPSSLCAGVSDWFVPPLEYLCFGVGGALYTYELTVAAGLLFSIYVFLNSPLKPNPSLYLFPLLFFFILLVSVLLYSTGLGVQQSAGLAYNSRLAFREEM